MRKEILMAALVTALAISGACDADGAPVAGGKAYFTAPGSANTAVTPYANHDATAAVTLVGGGVPLDSSGRAQVFLDRPADIRVEDSSGQTVATYRETGGTAAGLEVLNAGFTGTLPSGQQGAGGRTYLDAVLSNLFASLGGTDGYFQASSTATRRTLRNKFTDLSISVKDFGALGDGVKDDTAAVQAALDYAAGLHGGVVYFPPGSYLASAALVLHGNGIVMLGAGNNASQLVGSSTTANGIVGSLVDLEIRDLTITHKSSSSGTAIAVTDLVAYDVTVLGYASAVSTGNLSARSLRVVANGPGVAVRASYMWLDGFCNITSSTGIAVQVTTSGVVNGLIASGITAAVDVAAGAALAAFGVNTSAGGLRTDVASGAVFNYGCTWNSVNDRRTGAPVNYSVGTSSAITPLPMQADTIRINATAAITVTVNAPANLGFGRRFTLMCTNTSGGAVTWTFNAAYHLSASVAPATGNRVNLIIEHDPITGNFYEVGRAATSN